MAEEEQLTKEFECLVKYLECLFSCLSFREKSIATEWIKRLKKSDANIDELKLRLDFARCGLFGNEPFNKLPPPNEPLIKLGSLLPPEHKVRSLDANSDEQRNIYLNEMFEQMPDGDTFFEDQPVPNEGTFFLLLFERECGEEI